MPRLSDRAGSPKQLALTPPATRPSANDESVGTPDVCSITRLNRPSLHDPYRRFAATLTNGRRTAQGRRTDRYSLVVEQLPSPSLCRLSGAFVY